MQLKSLFILCGFLINRKESCKSHGTQTFNVHVINCHAEPEVLHGTILLTQKVIANKESRYYFEEHKKAETQEEVKLHA